jgi:hypothetical protein
MSEIRDAAPCVSVPLHREYIARGFSPSRPIGATLSPSKVSDRRDDLQRMGRFRLNPGKDEAEPEDVAIGILLADRERALGLRRIHVLLG